MGKAMALNLLKGGHTLHAHSRSGVPEDLVQAGAQPCASPSEVGRKADVIITMLPDTPDVETVLFGQDGLINGLAPKKIVIDMSSISPGATRDFASRIQALGCSYIDAPVSGGQVGAINASLTIMVGGDAAVFESVKPLLQLMGQNITLIGDSGAGQMCKVANQIIVALNIEAVAEAMLLASAAGVDPERVRQALMGGFASSRVLEVHGERMIKRNFEPGFRIELHHKDLNLALTAAQEMNIPLPNTTACQALFAECMANEGGQWDHSGLVQVLEDKAGRKVGLQDTVA
ncbi:MAG: 2-hydroxy-3-oxopropionate reductase [Burkholderiaceae bacterium]|nr:2-hydroxy-3-oxopropionate reductase [Burkholderiaceae bacterium]